MERASFGGWALDSAASMGYLESGHGLRGQRHWRACECVGYRALPVCRWVSSVLIAVDRPFSANVIGTYSMTWRRGVVWLTSVELLR
jgi:hypothetical protein